MEQLQVNEFLIENGIDVDIIEFLNKYYFQYELRNVH